MRNAIYLAASALFLCATFSCRQFVIPPHGGRPPGDSILTIDLACPNADTTDYGTSFELIISEPGGKVLLDTLAPYNAPIIAKMITHQPLVDVSTVVYSSTFDYYSMIVNKSVKPETWIVIPDAAPALSFPTGIPGTITYTNAPGVDYSSAQFASLPTNPGTQAPVTGNGNGQLEVNYYGLSGNNLAYLIVPSIGQYSYQPIHAVSDTLSLSQMDSTVGVYFTMPSQYSTVSSAMWGYLDTADFTKYLLLYNYYQSLPLGDLQYPPKSKVPAEKYYLAVEATTANNEFLAYRTYGATPPTGTLAVPFPATPVYTLNSTTTDSFSISFSQQPTLYTTNWSAGNINVSINASPDSTLIRALPFVTALHSKLLQGQTMSGLALQNFGYETLAGQTYSSYYSYETNPQQLVYNRFATDLLYLIFLQ
jgi:hypothetical protein